MTKWYREGPVSVSPRGMANAVSLDYLLTTKLRQLDPGAIEVGSVDRGLVRCAATSAVWLVWQQVFADLRFQASIDKSLSCYC